MLKNFLKIIACLIIPQLAGLIGSLFTTPHITTWYATLNRPSIAPPNWVFGPVWTFLFLLMGISLIPIIKSKIQHKEIAYIVFGTQLILNILWSVFFFGLQNPGLALFEIIFLWFVILMNILIFYKINKWAGLLLIPYWLWVSFAIALNYSFWILNK